MTNGSMDDEIFEEPIVSDYALEQAAIGSVMLVGIERPVPDDWLPCDGRQINSNERPEFRDKMGAPAQFALPAPVSMRSGMRHIIKVGPRVEYAAADRDANVNLRDLISQMGETQTQSESIEPAPLDPAPLLYMTTTEEGDLPPQVIAGG